MRRRTVNGPGASIDAVTTTRRRHPDGALPPNGAPVTNELPAAAGTAANQITAGSVASRLCVRCGDRERPEPLAPARRNPSQDASHTTRRGGNELMRHHNTKRRSRPRVPRTGILAAAACAIMLAAVPAGASAAHERFQELRVTPADPVPVFSLWPVTAGFAPTSVVGGSDNNVWYTEGGMAAGVGRLTFAGRNDGREGLVKDFTHGIQDRYGLLDITAGPDGNLWATGYGGEIFRVTPQGVVSHQSVAPYGGLQGITAGPDGKLWFAAGTGPDAAFDPAVGQITTHGAVKEFGTGIAPRSTPVDITEADGDLWFTEFFSGRIGRITPQGLVSEFQLLPETGQATFAGSGLFSIAADAGYLWVTDVNNDSVYRILPGECSTPRAGTPGGCDNVVDIGLANNAAGVTGAPGSVVAGPDGDVWATYGSALVRMTPQGQSTFFPQANASGGGGALPSSQSIGSGPFGTLWYPEGDGLGEVSFCSTVLCGSQLTQKPDSAELSGSLRRASSIGILIQRDGHGRLEPVGHVPLGHHPAGPFSVRWTLRVGDRRLPAGRYAITLRALNNHRQVIDKAAPVTTSLGG
jgi:streptogramin lyase